MNNDTRIDDVFYKLEATNKRVDKACGFTGTDSQIANEAFTALVRVIR